MKSILQWSKYIYKWAKSKGWWKPEKSALECHMMFVSEIAEATEEARKDKPAIYFNPVIPEHIDITKKFNPILKPEGEAVELADCVIRIMDYFAYKKWNLEEVMKIKMKYNESRPYRHGNKKY